MELVIFNQAKRALEQAASIDEVKIIRDKAEAMRLYVKQAGESLIMQNHCAEIKVRAERKAGEILNQTVKNKGTRLGGCIVQPPDSSPKLADIGISKTQSFRWQSMASIPEDIFENHVTEVINDGEKELTSAELLRIAKQLKSDKNIENLKNQVEESEFTAEKMEIHCSDCVEFMKNMDENSVDLTVTSPPYDDMRSYFNSPNFDFKRIAQGLFRVTKEGGIVVWVVADSTEQGSETGSSFKQALYFKEIGFRLHDTMIYLKTGTSYPSEKRYTQQFEYMFVFSKRNPKTFNPIMDEPRLWEGSWGTTRVRNHDGSISVREVSNEGKGRTGKNSDGDFGYKKRGNVWLIRNGHGFGHSDELSILHPATFPEQLANDHILTWSNPGDLVFDPMCGSGTTLKMSKINARNYIGVDICEKYCEIARKRVRMVEPQTYKRRI